MQCFGCFCMQNWCGSGSQESTLSRISAFGLPIEYFYDFLRANMLTCRFCQRLPYIYKYSITVGQITYSLLWEKIVCNVLITRRRNTNQNKNTTMFGICISAYPPPQALIFATINIKTIILISQRPETNFSHFFGGSQAPKHSFGYLLSLALPIFILVYIQNTY